MSRLNVDSTSLIRAACILAGFSEHSHAYDIPTHKTFLTERSAILQHKKSGQNYIANPN